MNRRSKNRNLLRWRNTSSEFEISYDSPAPETKPKFSSSPEIIPDEPFSKPATPFRKRLSNNFQDRKHRFSKHRLWNLTNPSLPSIQSKTCRSNSPFLTPPVQQNFAPPVAAESEFSPARSNPQAKARMDNLFKLMSEAGASDLHMSVSMPPMIRKDGKMQATRMP